MRPTSDTQYRGTATGKLPPLEPVREGVYALPQPYDGLTTTYTLSYLITDSIGGLHVIDPGPESDANWARFTAAVRAMGREVTSVTVTHSHDDHLGMAWRVRYATGAPIAIHKADSGELPHSGGQEADVFLEDGSLLSVPGREIRVVHTPGHTPGSICLYESRERLLFTGDHVLPHQFPGVGLGSRSERNPMADYLESLERVAKLEAEEALPGHEYRFRGVTERCAETSAHHRSRTAEVTAIVADAPDARPEEVATRLTWSRGWENLEGRARDSAVAQTRMHMLLAAATRRE